MNTDINETILATLSQAVTAKADIAKATKEPAAQYEGFMVSAVLLGYDLTEKEWEGCKEYLKANDIPKGTRNAISRFMLPNVGHENLKGLLKGCKSDALEARQKHLAKDRIVSFRDLSKACIVVSEGAVNDSIAKKLAGMSTERQATIVALADKLRLDDEAKEQKKDMAAKQTDYAKFTAKPRKKAVNE